MPRRRRTAHLDDEDFDDVDALELQATLLLADLRNVVGEMSGLLAPPEEEEDSW
jgi:hypothetical protein